MIGFTQSSYPAYELPSDEDYKTLPFVIAPQRWVKDLEYASLTLLFSSDEEAIEVSHINLGA